MWYEIFPSLMIVSGLVLLPQVCLPHIAKAIYGFPVLRDVEEFWNRRMFIRDCALTDNTLIGGGLENIPDAPESQKK